MTFHLISTKMVLHGDAITYHLGSKFNTELYKANDKWSSLQFVFPSFHMSHSYSQCCQFWLFPIWYLWAYPEICTTKWLASDVELILLIFRILCIVNIWLKGMHVAVYSPIGAFIITSWHSRMRIRFMCSYILVPSTHKANFHTNIINFIRCGWYKRNITLEFHKLKIGLTDFVDNQFRIYHIFLRMIIFLLCFVKTVYKC